VIAREPESSEALIYIAMSRLMLRTYAEAEFLAKSFLKLQQWLKLEITQLANQISGSGATR